MKVVGKPSIGTKLRKAEGKMSSTGSSRATVYQPTHPETTVLTMAGIPCLNEERHIGRVVAEARKFVDLVFVVDDGSTDRTADLAAQAGAEVVRHPVNKGKGVAIAAIFERARELGVEALVLLDGDGQHRPGDIYTVTKPVLMSGVDVVVGSRFRDRTSRVPFYRTIGLHVLTLAANLGSGVWLTDSQNGFRAFSKRAIRCFQLEEAGFAVESEMQFLIAEHRLRVVEAPVVVDYFTRAKRSPLTHGFGNLLKSFRITFRRRPLRLLGTTSIATAALGGGLAVADLAVGSTLIVLSGVAALTGVVLEVRRARPRKGDLTECLR